MICCHYAKPYCSLCWGLLGPIESGYQIEWCRRSDNFECVFAHPIRDRPFKLMKRVMNSSSGFFGNTPCSGFHRKTRLCGTVAAQLGGSTHAIASVPIVHGDGLCNCRGQRWWRRRGWELSVDMIINVWWFVAIMLNHIVVFVVVSLNPLNLDTRLNGAGGVTILNVFLSTRSATDHSN